jgi:hypothetical protein
MNTQRFDAMTWHLGTVNSRRRTLTALLVTMFSATFRGSPEPTAVAKSKHKKKRAQCGANTPCPPETPCCIKGACRTLCGESCCEDCFAEIHLPVTEPDLEHAVCCVEGVGTVCHTDARAKKKHKHGRTKRKANSANDLCCYPDEVCVKGECCCDGCLGTMVCGGECCPIASCCNGKCCQDGLVCATTPQGPACVAADRGCGGDQDCFAGEVCHAGVCCSSNRVCKGGGHDVCCATNERCEQPPNGICCPNGSICSTYRGHRVRV